MAGILQKKRSCPGAGTRILHQQPKPPQIRLRICQMEQQPVLQPELQEKKNILPTSLSEFVSRGQEEL